MSKYQEDINLNQYDLEYELIRQASLFLKYSELAVDAGFERDKIKERIKLAETEIDLDIRQDYEQFGFDCKPTEAAIKAAIVQHDSHRKVTRKYIEATRVFNSLTGAKTALEHKKKALELLVSLVIRGYSAEPKVDPDIKYNRQIGGHTEINRELAENQRLKKKN